MNKKIIFIFSALSLLRPMLCAGQVYIVGRFSNEAASDTVLESR